jgi:dephospho-CoA kinase
VGGIGAGKSTVMRRLGELGVTVLDADSIGHEVLSPGSLAAEAVRLRWPHVVDGGGVVDRAALAAIVFNDHAELEALEGITHPDIAEEIAARTAAAGDHPVAVELPVAAGLVAGRWVTIAVVAPFELRIARTVERGLTEADAVARAANQVPDTAWAASADHVIVNDGSQEDLEAKVDDLYNELSTQH